MWACVCVCVCVCVRVYMRSEEHTSELQSHLNLVCRLLLVKNRIEEVGKVPPCVLLHKRAYITQSLYSHNDKKITHNMYFINDTATTEIYALSLHDALPI